MKLCLPPRFRMAALFLLLPALMAVAETREIPAWYSLNARLPVPPQVNVPLQTEVTVAAPVGDLKDVEISLLAPAGWAPATPTARAAVIPAGESRTFTFSLTPKGPIPNGSIVAVMRAVVPKGPLQEKIRSTMGPEAPGLLERLAALPPTGEGFADISFALFPEEGFYPLSGDMWTYYDDRLKPEGMSRGPSLFREAVVTPFQAQTDVEMYEKLERLLQTDPNFGKSLEGSGVDLLRKKGDQMLGLYILGTEAFLKSDFGAAQQFLGRLQEELASAPATMAHDLVLQAGNLRGLVYWAQGDRRAAADTLRKTFYLDRKEPAQRYLLRNLGLLMLDTGDRSTAREMFRLGLDLKPAYSLLREEFEKLKNP